MKKLFLLAGTFLFAIMVNAQTIPNSDLETWVAEGEYEIPEGWETSNEASYAAPFNYLTAEKTDDAYSGEWAVKLISQTIVGFISPGFITTSRFDFTIMPMSSELNGGVYFPYRPESISGYYKYNPSVSTDRCFVGGILLKYNDRSTPDTVGTAIFYGTEAVTDYTMFTMTFDYWTDDTPDSLSLTVMCTDPESPESDSEMWIDDLSVEMPTGISIPLLSEKSFVFPNPAKDITRINVEEKSVISIYALSGQLISMQNYSAGVHELNVSMLKSGQYLIRKSSNNETKTQILLVQ